ncbi:MFS transporter [Escherichia coli]
MFEVPFLLVGCFKYITSQFEVRFFQRRFIWSVSASLSNWR